MANGTDQILRGFSVEPDPERAARELFESIGQPDASLCIFFCSTEYDIGEIGRALVREFGDTPVIGCTSSGEITPMGYSHGSLTGFSFPANDFTCASARIDDLSAFTIESGHRLTKDLIAELDDKQPKFRADDTFAFIMIDGMCRCEESVVSSIFSALGDIPLFGGSAGDNLNFDRTFVFHDGEFHTDSAVITLVRTANPFKVFKTQHFLSTGKKMVVTGADPASRTVSEINAEPAAKEYARLVGLGEERLSPMIFATYPVVVKVGGTEHVRAIQKVNEDGSLSFFCAIDEGIVLTVARGVDIMTNLEEVLGKVKQEIGQPQLILGCDCVLRSLELEQKQIKPEVGDLMSRFNAIGFNTYGEQFQAMHVNQTFTGVAIGAREE